MTDLTDKVEVFSAAFVDAFGSRAFDVAAEQRERADGIVRERWQQIADVIMAAV